MKLTRRGRLVRSLFILIAIAALWYISGHVWYVPNIDGGGGYCFGSLSHCFP